MRHCSNCHYCVVDTRAIVLLGIYTHKCKLKGKGIVHPFWEGFICRRWRVQKKEKGGEG